MTVSDIKENVRNWKLTSERVTNLIIGFAALLIYEFIARPIYRPYIYKNNINDFHLADTIGNTLGVMAAIFVLIGFIGQGRTQHLFLIKTITIAMVVYEIGQPLLGKSIDSWDIVATIITGGICLVIYNSVHPKPVGKEQKTNKT